MMSACTGVLAGMDGSDDFLALDDKFKRIPIVSTPEQDDNIASMVVIMAAELRTLKAEVIQLKRTMASTTAGSSAVRADADTDDVDNADTATQAETEGPSGDGSADADADAPDADAEAEDEDEGNDTAAGDEEGKDATELLHEKPRTRRGHGRKGRRSKGGAASALGSPGKSKDGAVSATDLQQQEEVVVALLASEMREYLDTSSYCQTQCSLMYTAEQLRRGEPVAYAVLVRLIVAMVLSCLLIFLQNVAFAVINDEQALLLFADHDTTVTC